MYDWLIPMFLMQTADGGAGGDAGDGSGEGGTGEASGTGDAGSGEGSGDSESGSEGDSQDGGDAGSTTPGGSAMTGKTGDDGSEEGGEGKPDTGTQAPESYAQFDVPTGMEIADAQLEAASPVFKELGLSQEGAQKLINLQVAEVNRQAEAWKTETTGWLNELKADKIVGGANFGESVKTVAQFIKTHAGDGYGDLSQFLDMGYGNYPPLFKLIHSMALRTKEDSFNGPGRQDGGPKSEADKLRSQYPSMPDSAFQDVG